MQHCAAGQESGAARRHSGVAGDAVVQPENVAERRKASGVAGTCSSTAEDVAVRWMPGGMLSGPGETLWNVAGWRWKSRQPGDAVRRQAEDGTMVGGGAGDRSGGGRHIGRRRMHLEAEDASEGGRCIRRQKMHRKVEDVSGAEAESEMEKRGIRGFPLQKSVFQSHYWVWDSIKTHSTQDTRNDIPMVFTGGQR